MSSVSVLGVAFCVSANSVMSLIASSAVGSTPRALRRVIAACLTFLRLSADIAGPSAWGCAFDARFFAGFFAGCGVRGGLSGAGRSTKSSPSRSRSSVVTRASAPVCRPARIRNGSARFLRVHLVADRDQKLLLKTLTRLVQHDRSALSALTFANRELHHRESVLLWRCGRIVDMIEPKLANFDLRVRCRPRIQGRLPLETPPRRSPNSSRCSSRLKPPLTTDTQAVGAHAALDRRRR